MDTAGVLPSFAGMAGPRSAWAPYDTYPRAGRARACATRMRCANCKR